MRLGSLSVLSVMTCWVRAGWVAALAAVATSTWAANPDGPLRVEVIAAYNLVVDSNVESPSTYAPRAAFLGAKIWNDGSTTLSNVVAYIGNYVDGVNDTPGLYPTNRHPAYPTIVGPLPGGYFQLTHEGGAAGAADATRPLGPISPGQYAAVYWLISYPNVDKNGKAVWGPSVKPDDDLWLEYDVWARAVSAGTPRSAVQTRRVTMRNEISAMANKIQPNTANKVPQEYQELLNLYVPTWTNSAADGTPGSRVTAEGVWYDLGNVGQGFDNDGDLVPDKNAWMQPVGDAAAFDASCFRLVHTYALVIVKLKTGGEDVLYAEDQLYFQNIPENNGAVGWVGYEFVPLRGGCSSGLTPYQEVASGFDNEKFNGDYGAVLGGSLSSGSSAVELVKSADGLTVRPGGTLWYSLTYTPTRATFASGLPLLLGDPAAGVPVVIQDRIPAGTTYIAGSATASNALPLGVGGYTVLYSTNSAVSWQQTEPPAAKVTDLQWWLSDQLAGGTTGTVRFAVSVSNPFNQPVPEVSNTGCLSFGNNECDTNSIVRTPVLGTNVLGDLVFRDNGAGAFYGNGTNNVGETGIANMTVSVYFDANSNGVADATDILFGVTNTAANGAYLFSSLPDGKYVVVVDTADPNLPFGYSPTTPITRAIALDPNHATTASVTNLTADFGFAPALTLDKSLVGAGPVYEGRQATFRLAVTNQFPGNGKGTGGTLVVTNWATARDTAKDTGTGWANQANAVGAVNGTMATLTVGNNVDKMGLTGYGTGARTETITNVTLAVRMGNVDRAKPFTFSVVLWTNATSSVTVGTYTDVTLPANGDLLINVTGLRTWQWTHFSTITIQLTGSKNGGSGGNTINVDAAGFRIGTNYRFAAGTAGNTLYPVPLNDRYDADLLRFVSATPPVNTAATGASQPLDGALHWDNIGPIQPGGTSVVYVTFDVLQPPGNLAATVTNMAYVNSATFSNGVPANTATALASVVVQPTANLGDYVWRDTNADGKQGTNEVGIANVKVELTYPTGVKVTNTTDSTGHYLFTGLTATNYTVTVLTASLPSGTFTNTYDRDGNKNNQTSVTITNVPGLGPIDVLTADFGYSLPSIISGTVWHDMDRDHATAPESGEDRLSGVTVGLYTTGGVFIANTTTDVNGYFKFTGPYTGPYEVRVSTNTGALATGTWVRSYDTDGTNTANKVTTLSIVAGGSATADFSYYKTGAYRIGDTLFYDVNGNGLQDAGEEGLPNVDVYLYEDANGNGLVDAGVDALMGVRSTSAGGTYLFTSLPAGTYLVIVDRTDPQFPAGATCTADPDAVKDGRSKVTISTADKLDQDFGFRLPATGSIGDTVWRDMNGNGVQSGPTETGIAGITVWLYADLNADGVFTNLATTTTDASGKYLFTGLPAGNYRVVVNAADSDIPEDFFGVPYVPTTVTTRPVALAAGATYLGADFGFAPLGTIGDTLFWDLNGNGQQDWNEPGITNQTVELYRDIDEDGIYDPGTDTYVTNAVTTTNGYYRFDGLTGDVYVVWVKREGAVTNATLMADPDTDGLPCTHPDVLADPALSNKCDGAYGVTVTYGTAFMGADFGYQPAGVLGDTVWFDVNTNGVRDVGEYGIPYIDVVLWSNGTAIATNQTDADGYYFFYDLVDGTYKVVVATGGTNWPAGVAQVYDPDGTNDSQAVGVVVSNRHVISIGPNAVTNDLDVDFGYRYAGANLLSGTVGLDAQPYDGLLNGANPSGAAAGEAAFSNVTVYAWWWRDDGDGVREANELVLVASTTTAPNGDYSFAGLPATAGSNYYVIALSAPRDELTLTTTNGSTTALSVESTTGALGYVQSARQVVTTTNAVTTNIDFAFALAAAYDFGDLPDTYSTSLSASPQGARHRIPGAPALYLGAAIDAEPNGQPTADATGDDVNGATPDDEDGVQAVGVWSNGASGGVVRVTVGAGSGWLVGWMDFNQGGTFAGSGEMIVNQAVSSTGGVGGVYTIAFAIPTNGISAVTNTVLNARFRLFPSQPGIPAIAYSGLSDGGEVEDYQWRFAAVGDYVWDDANTNGVPDGGESPIPGVTVFVDLNTNGVLDAGEPSTTTAGDGTYHIGGFQDGVHRVAIATNSLPSGSTPTYDIDGTLDWGGTFTISNTTSRSDVDFGINLPPPTLAVVIDVRAVWRDARAWVQWRTGAEIGSLGYWLERRTPAGWVTVNTRMLPAKIAQPLPRSYEVPDAGAEDGGTYTYRLVELENTGRRIVHGPYTVTVGGDGYGYAVWAEGIDWGEAASGRGDDPDGDRLTNFEEFLAGTDPLARDSVLRITHMRMRDGMVVLFWRSVEGRVYAVEAGPRPNGPFLPVAAGLESTPPVNSFACPLGADREPMYYRVIVSEP